MLSQTTEYALRLGVHLASKDGTPATIAELTEATRIPSGYLAKVLRQLARAGLVRSQRGPRGGSVLARPADEVSVLDVVQADGPLKRITVCPVGLRTHGVNLCPLHRRLDAAIASVERVFAESSLAELLTDRGAVRPLCEASMPRRPAAGGRS